MVEVVAVAARPAHMYMSVALQLAAAFACGPRFCCVPFVVPIRAKKTKNNKTTEGLEDGQSAVRGAYAELFIPKPKGTFGCKAADCVHATSNLMRALDFHSIRGHSIAGYGVTLCTVAPMQRGS